MDGAGLSKEQLLERIRDLEMLNEELLKEKEQSVTLEYAWTGNLGHWYWNIESNEVTFNPLKVTALGYEKSEIPHKVTYQFFTDKIHPEDYEKTMGAMRDHLYGRTSVYEVEYRIKAKDGKYKWFYDRGKITQTDENGKPLFLAGIVFDITEKKETQAELEQKNRILSEMSAIDGLTKINNHRSLIATLNECMARAGRTGGNLSIALFDIDDFKKVNDGKGHIYGDQVLVEVAAMIKKNIRDTDFAGRYGGEEFMVIFENAGLAAAADISDRVRKAVESNCFAGGITVTISGGVKQYQGEELTDFIREADENLYKAKRSGKNRVVS